MEQLKRNDIIELSIHGITSKGQGVGRHNGRVVFVPNTAPEDLAMVEIVNLQKSHAFGVVSKLITPSTHRVENTCPVYPECGGCSLRHLKYSKECEEKEDMVIQNLKRIGKMDIPFDDFIPSPKVDRYRNKAQFPLDLVNGKIRFGFYAVRSHDLIPLEDCLLQPEIYSKIAQIFCILADNEGLSVYDEKTHKGMLRHLLLRSNSQGEVLVTVVVEEDGSLEPIKNCLKNLDKDFPKIVATTLNCNNEKTNVILGKKDIIVTGNGLLTDTLGGVELSLSPQSFYQVNREGAELLYAKVKEYTQLREDDVLLDLYCGIGSIGLSMAKDVKKVVGVEIVPNAVEDAKKNAVANGIYNAEFHLGDAGKAAELFQKQGLSPTVVVIDPPRKGTDQVTLTAIGKMGPDRIVYVSCNSATLARDGKFLEEQGYRAIKACGVDLFPRTTHVECLVLFEKIYK